ncbi:MAG: hypothetical protein WD381_00665 [Balneolaceae bacterium]
MTSEIHSLFVLLLALFTLGATFLALYSVANAVRLRNVRLSWNTGKLKGYPLFSTLFLLSTVGIISVVFQLQLEQYYTIFGCYAWMGLSWSVSSYLASKSYITDHGIVKNINDPSQTVAWHQICDYVEKPQSKGSEFVFIYKNLSGSGENENDLIRLELNVPDRKISKFEKVIALKIGRSMTPVSDTSFDIKIIE